MFLVVLDTYSPGGTLMPTANVVEKKAHYRKSSGIKARHPGGSLAGKFVIVAKIEQSVTTAIAGRSGVSSSNAQFSENLSKR